MDCNPINAKIRNARVIEIEIQMVQRSRKPCTQGKASSISYFSLQDSEVQVLDGVCQVLGQEAQACVRNRGRASIEIEDELPQASPRQGLNEDLCLELMAAFEAKIDFVEPRPAESSTQGTQIVAFHHRR